ncbi:AAA family ATPase [Agromyces mangrovi Wang et al. 2018]|uniref:AAA family ATPase n=1 Tax=Agromyces mangrovi TaxID=1858653 RepID=UPI0025737800|nr:AAA family ATPase [Agromyces mangrovi]BDZ64310.1 hypothetical protein GCM10025877_12480 [Agromyces mangrovi]
MLIVLRGNSGSGKSTVARLLQAELDGPAANLGQDHFRRIVYREREHESMAHAELLELAAVHCLGRGDHVILEGIFSTHHYSDMIERIAAHATDARFFAFDLDFDETARRHATRPWPRSSAPTRCATGTTAGNRSTSSRSSASAPTSHPSTSSRASSAAPDAGGRSPQ